MPLGWTATTFNKTHAHFRAMVLWIRPGGYWGWTVFDTNKVMRELGGGLAIAASGTSTTAEAAAREADAFMGVIGEVTPPLPTVFGIMTTDTPAAPSFTSYEAARSAAALADQRTDRRPTGIAKYELTEIKPL